MELPLNREGKTVVSGFDFDGIEPSNDFKWSKRGRKKTPLNPKLIEALRQSYGTGITAHLVMPNEQVNAFYNLLSKAGRELNYRINREVEKDKPEQGMSTYHFKVIGLRDKDLASD